MAKNETALVWLEKNHPEIYAMYLEYVANKRREKAKEYQRNIAAKAKAHDKKV